MVRSTCVELSVCVCVCMYVLVCARVTSGSCSVLRPEHIVPRVHLWALRRDRGGIVCCNCNTHTRTLAHIRHTTASALYIVVSSRMRFLRAPAHQSSSFRRRWCCDLVHHRARARRSHASKLTLERLHECVDSRTRPYALLLKLYKRRSPEKSGADKGAHGFVAIWETYLP